MAYDDHSEYPRGVVYASTGGTELIPAGTAVRVAGFITTNLAAADRLVQLKDADDVIYHYWSRNPLLTTQVHPVSFLAPNGLLWKGGTSHAITVFYWKLDDSF